MTSATREKIIIVAFPAVLVVGTYWYFMSQGGQLAAALVDLEAVRSSAAPPEAVDAARMQLANLNGEKTKLTVDKLNLDARWAAVSAFRNRPAAARTEALQQLTHMLWRRGLFGVEESPLEGSSSPLPAALDDAVRRIAGPSSSATPRFWEVKFLGKYLDVQKLLDELAESELPLVPISLNMAEASVDTDWRSWTLVLWM